MMRTVRASDGEPLLVEEAGVDDGGARPPIVFLHGALAGRSTFRKLRKWFEDDRRLVLTVLRGHEDNRASLPADYTLTITEVDDLGAILDALGLAQVDIFAHSSGATIAIALALQQPERIRRMVLVEPTLLPLLDEASMTRARSEIAPVLAAAEAGDDAAALRELLAFVGGPSWPELDPEVKARLAATLAPYASMAAPHARALVDLAISAGDIEALQPPTLLVYGTQSLWIEPMMAARLQQLRPDLGQLQVEGAGHAAHADRPDVVGPEAAAFLS